MVLLGNGSWMLGQNIRRPLDSIRNTVVQFQFKKDIAFILSTELF